MILLKKYLCFDLSAGVLFIACFEIIFYSTAFSYLLNSLIYLPYQLKKAEKQMLAEQKRDAEFQYQLRIFEKWRNRRQMVKMLEQEQPQNRSYRIEISGKRKRSVSADTVALTDDPSASARAFPNYPKFQALSSGRRYKSDNLSSTESGLFSAIATVTIYIALNLLLIVGYFKGKASFIASYAVLAFASVLVFTVFMVLFIALAIVKEDKEFYKFAAVTPIGMCYYAYNGLSVYSFYRRYS